MRNYFVAFSSKYLKRKFFIQGTWLYISRIMIGIVPFFSIPAIIDGFGRNVWVELVVYQTIGQILATFVELSWNSTGLSRVVLTNDRRIFLSCFRQKSSIFIALTMFFLTFLLIAFPINYKSIFVFSSLIYSISLGLSNSWAWIGKEQNAKYIKFEALPRILSGIIFLPLVYSGNFLLGSIYFFLLMIVNWSTSFMPINLFCRFSNRVHSESLQMELKFGITRLIQTVYFSSFLPLHTFLGGTNLFEVAMYDRIYRLTQSLVNPLSQFLSSQLLISKSTFIRKIIALALLNVLYIFLYFLMCFSLISRLLFKESLVLSLIFILYLVLGVLVRSNTFIGNLYLFKKDLNNYYIFLGLLCSFIFIVLAFPFSKSYGFEGILYNAILAEGFFFVGLIVLKRSKKIIKW